MTRRTWMWLALLATLGSSAWLSGEAPDDGIGLARQSAGEGGSPRPATSPSRVTDAAWPAPPSPRASAPWSFDSEQAQAWVVAPPPPPPPPSRPVPQPSVSAASALPQPPLFPYALVGRVDDGTSVHALLSSPTQTLGVKAQDVIDGQWRVDSVDARGLVLTWLPGGQRKTVAFRSS